MGARRDQKKTKAAMNRRTPEEEKTKAAMNRRTPEGGSLRVAWEGGIAGVQSLALVNRELCRRLAESDLELSILPSEAHPAMGVPELLLPAALSRRFRR